MNILQGPIYVPSLAQRMNNVDPRVSTVEVKTLQASINSVLYDCQYRGFVLNGSVVNGEVVNRLDLIRDDVINIMKVASK